MSSIIFYGAGKNAYENFTRWCENGLTPVCFADSDIRKQHTVFDGSHPRKLEILPLLEAIDKYPDYLLYLTQIESQLASITNFLFAIGIPKERIRYCDGFQKPTCCSYLEQNTILAGSDPNGKSCYSYCCANISYKTNFFSNGSFEYDYEHLLGYTRQLKQLLNEGYYTHCDGCSRQRAIHDDFQVKNKFIIDSGVVGGDMCDFSCCYCLCTNISHGKRESTFKIDKKYDVLKILHHIEKNYKAENVFLIYAAAEIGVAKKYGSHVFEIWNRNKWRGRISSNASVFLPGIDALLKQKLIKLITSLDSGTPETFAKIKGVDMFEKVIENLEKYAATGGAIGIKYIVLEGVNDNESEIDSFTNIAAGLSKINNNTEVWLSRDYRVNHLKATEREVYAFKYMINRIKQLKLNFTFNYDTFSSEDIDMIN